MDAIEELKGYLHDGETVEGIVFGAWGSGFMFDELAYGEPDPPPVPLDVRGKVLTLEQAAPYMVGWCFRGGYGSADCYAVYIWTTERLIWVTQYDGATDLDSAPRNPTETMPVMFGCG